jgi:hypothetical protein
MSYNLFQSIILQYVQVSELLRAFFFLIKLWLLQKNIVQNYVTKYIQFSLIVLPLSMNISNYDPEQ